MRVRIFLPLPNARMGEWSKPKVCKTFFRWFESSYVLKTCEFIMDNWEILKEKLNEQIADCRKYGSRFQRPYREVLKMMAAIENGTQDVLKPCNCSWKTQEEIDKIYKED